MKREPIIREGRAFLGVWIPADLYLDQSLSWNEKIALIEIGSLSKTGECFAGNQHFANLLGISKKRAESIISGLRAKGYITSELIYKNGTKEVERRIIRLTNNNIVPSPQKQGYPPLKNEDTPILKNEGDKEYIYNNTSYKYKGEEYKECGESAQQISPHEKIGIENEPWEWKSRYQYKTYLEKRMPQYVRNIVSDFVDHDNAARILVKIVTEYFDLYSINTGKLHPWYSEKHLKECFNELFRHGGDIINQNNVIELMREFFRHKGERRDYHMKVFATPNMLKYCQALVNGEPEIISELQEEELLLA